MSILSRLFGRRRVEYKETAARKLLATFGVDQVVPTPRRYDALAEEGYKKNAVVFRCVDLICSAAATLPVELWQGRGKAARQVKGDHPVMGLLDRPNPWDGGEDFMYMVLAYRLLSGNTYVEMVPEMGEPLELWTHRPDRMTVVKGRNGQPAGYEYSANGRKLRWDADPINGQSAIIHSKSFNPLDDWYGMSPLEAAAFEVDQHNAAGMWNFSLLRNSARPSGAVVYEPKDDPGAVMNEEQFQRVKSEIEEQYASTGKRGRPMLLEGGLKWVEMALSPKDMDFMRGKDLSARDTAMAFHVPPQLVGIEGSQTYANYEQATMSLYTDAVLPLYRKVLGDLEKIAARWSPDLHFVIDDDSIDALAPRRHELWEKLEAASFLTVNEKRAAAGYEEVDGGDVVLVPATQVPLGEEGMPDKEPEPEEDEEEDSEDDEKLGRLAYGDRPRLVS